MRHKHPFLTRKGDDGFNWRTLLARKGDAGFNPTRARPSKGDINFKQPHTQLAGSVYTTSRYTRAHPPENSHVIRSNQPLNNTQKR